MQHEHVRIAVMDSKPAGVESVPARRVSEDEWQLIRSPLYATGVASGDVIRVIDAESGVFEVVTRGGNVCVQFYLGEVDADSADETGRIARAIGAQVDPLGGRVDGTTPGLISFTLPVAVGFSEIENIFEMAVRNCAGAQWQFANVYDEVSGEPLGWWE